MFSAFLDHVTISCVNDLCCVLTFFFLLQDAFINDVRRHVQKFVEQKYVEIEYNHKTD